MGQKWSLPLVRVFFQILKKVPKRFKTVQNGAKNAKNGKKIRKKIKKNDPRAQLRCEKWSFLVICRCHIGFF